MKLLIILLALPFVGLGQGAGGTSPVTNSRGGVILLDTTPYEQRPNNNWITVHDSVLRSMLEGKFEPVKLNVPKFQFIDTINGTVEYLVRVDSNKYESIKAKGYKIDSVFYTYVDNSAERNTNGRMALYIDLVETRTTFRIIANGREINRYKYYTFIPESQMQKK